MSILKMSYGTIPGNGHHKSDDKVMNAGPGHVVPGENLHVAKRLVSDMGYDPDASVDLNQGRGNGQNIKISSGEFFMNEQQVEELRNKGVNPESLSPNSKYNQSGNNMNGGPNAYASGGMTLYELMMNNNNQYPSYQDAGSTDPLKDPWEQRPANEILMPPGATADQGSELPSAPRDMKENFPISTEMQVLDPNSWSPNIPDYDPLREPWEQLPAGEILSPGNPDQGSDLPITPGNLREPYNLGPKPFEAEKPAGKSPEDIYLQDLLHKNKKSADKEVLANMAMFGWNASRGRMPGEQPKMVHMREAVRDYQGMKNLAAGDLERAERRNAYTLKQLGAPEKIVGLHANTIQGANKINESIWDMQGQDSMQNAGVANQVRMDYENAMRQYRANESAATQNFRDMKGKNMAENVAQTFDVRDNELSNETTLRGYKKNQEMDELDRQYNTLSKNAFQGKYFSRQDWYKMTPDQRSKYIKTSDEHTAKMKGSTNQG